MSTTTCDSTGRSGGRARQSQTQATPGAQCSRQRRWLRRRPGGPELSVCGAEEKATWAPGRGGGEGRAPKVRVLPRGWGLVLMKWGQQKALGKKSGVQGFKVFLRRPCLLLENRL